MESKKRQGAFHRMSVAVGHFFLISKKKEYLRKKIRQAGYQNIPYPQIGGLFIFSLLATLAIYGYFLLTIGIRYDIVGIVILTPFVLIITELVVLFLMYYLLKIYLEIKIFNRIQNIEQNLPLFLRSFSTNLKAGREFVDALEDSVSSDIGVLNDDLSQLIIEIRSGEMTEKVLQEYIERYDFYAVKETFEIILDAYKGGGGLSDIIERIADNLQIIQYLKKSAVASVANYIMFMTMIALFIAPILFALSYNLLDLIDKLFRRVLAGGTSPFLPAFIGPLDIDFRDFEVFSRWAIGIIAGSAGAIIGIIKKGNLKGSAMKILTFVVISILVYQFSLIIIIEMFKALFLF